MIKPAWEKYRTILAFSETIAPNKTKANNKIDAPYPVLVGYLGYPMIKYIETIKLKNLDTLKIPEAVMIRPKLVAVFDNIKDTINIMTAIYPKKQINALEAYDQGNKRITKESIILFGDIKLNENIDSNEINLNTAAELLNNSQ